MIESATGRSSPLLEPSQFSRNGGCCALRSLASLTLDPALFVIKGQATLAERGDGGQSGQGPKDIGLQTLCFKSEILLLFLDSWPSIALIASLLATEGNVALACCLSGMGSILHVFPTFAAGREGGREALHRQIGGHLHFPFKELKALLSPNLSHVFLKVHTLNCANYDSGLAWGTVENEEMAQGHLSSASLEQIDTVIGTSSMKSRDRRQDVVQEMEGK